MAIHKKSFLLIIFFLILTLLTIPQAVLAATITVDVGDSSHVDDGACSLREAIDNANSDSQVYGSAGECATGSLTDTIIISGTITLTDVDNVTNGNNGTPVITSPIIINGNDNIIERSTSITETLRLFYVDAGGQFELNDLHLQNGEADNGGAIYNRGILLANNSTFTNNVTTGNGGAIVNVLNADTTITNSLFDGNTAAFGGAIQNSGSSVVVTVADSTFSDNTAEAGGAIYQFGGSNLTVTNSAFTSNVATGNSASGGGAIFNYNFSVVNVYDSHFVGNSAGNTGGAISNIDGSTLNVYNSLLSGNWTDVFGGAIFNNTIDTDIATVTIVNSTFGGNFVNSNGGAVYSNGDLTIENSLIWGNSNQQIYINSGLADVSYSGVENGFSGTGNITLSSSDDVFVDPVTPLSAPTALGDYHLDDASVVINQGDNATAISASLTLDIDGDDRILNGTVDMGADEIDFCAEITFPYTALTPTFLSLAIDCANANATTDTIRLGTDITLTDIHNVVASDGNNGLPVITSPIILGGQGYTLSRSNAISDTFRLFYVDSTGYLSIFNTTLSNGSAQNVDVIEGNDDRSGGAIFINANGTLILNNLVTFSDNVSDGEGGAIFNRGGQLTLNNGTTFSGNEAVGTSNFTFYYGGAIYSNSDYDLDVTGTTMISNTASDGGSAIYAEGNGALSISTSTIENNTSGSGGAVASVGNVLTIHNTDILNNLSSGAGGGIFSNALSATITDSTIDNNTTNNQGGGIYHALAGSTLTVSGSTISNNHSALQGGGIAITGSGADTIIIENSTINNNSNASGPGGAGIFNNLTGSVSISGTTAMSNTAVGNGGGFSFVGNDLPVEVRNSTFSNNQSGASGGGLHVSTSGTGGLIVHNVDFVGNTASTDGGGLASNAVALSVTDSLFDDNTTTVDDGGGLYHTLAGSTAYIADSDFTGNFATSAGGGLYVEFNSTTTTIENVNLFNNQANSLGGGGYAGASSSISVSGTTAISNTGSTGGMMIVSNGTTTVTNSTFNENTSIAGSGGINVGGVVVTVQNVEANNNQASGVGGGISGSASTSFTMMNTTSINNTSISTGGGFFFSNTGVPISIIDSSFNSNTTSNDGGGLYISASTISLEGVEIISNTITTGSFDGGGAELTANTGGVNPSISISGTTVISNTATNYAGGLYTFANTGIVVNNSIIRNNTSSDRGGGWYPLTGGVVRLLNSEISGNTNTTGQGGGIFTNGGSLIVTNSTISGNTTEQFGGGIYTTAVGTVILTNNTIANNESVSTSATGGGIFTNGANVTSRNNIIAGNESNHVSGADDCAFSGGSAGGSNNLDSDGTCGTGYTQSGSINLDVLADNGGSNGLTHALLSGSDAIDYGDNDFLNEVSVSLDLNGDGDTADDLADLYDQRGVGFARLDSIAVDAGAFESDICPNFPTTVGTSATLIFAITCANYNPITATINLSGSITLTEIDNTINGNNGLPAISSPIIINGNDNTIERDSGASDLFRLFHVSANGDLMINDATLSGGSVFNSDAGSSVDDDGGAIMILASTLTLNNVTVTGNTATNNGSGIAGFGISFINIYDSLIDDNDGAGGGIYIEQNASFLTMDNSIIRNHNASFAGAAIAFNGNSDGLITDSYIIGNSSTSNGGAIYLRNGDVTIKNSIISGNSANNGGAIIIEESSADLDLRNVTIAGNSANNGGAIYNNGAIDMVNTIIANNHANTNPQINNSAGLLIMEYSGLEGGTSALTGTLFINAGNVDLTASDNIFVNPVSATIAPTTTGDYHLAVSLSNPVINAGIDAVAIFENLTQDIDGDDRFQGGVVDMGADEAAICSLINFPYTANTSATLILAIHCANATAMTDTILLGTNITLTEIDNVTDGDNGLPSIVTPIIFGGQGNTLERSDAISETFRLLHIGVGGKLSIYATTLHNGDAGTHYGGAIFHETLSALTVVNSTFTNNRGNYGGAIYMEASTSSSILDNLIVQNSTFTNNLASFDGGAIYYYPNLGIVSIENSTFSQNQAEDTGGALYLEDLLSGSIISDTIFLSNVSATAGGAIYLYGDELQMNNNQFIGNMSSTTGGALYVNRTNEVLDLYNNLFSGNAATHGGAVYVNATISGNPDVAIVNNTFGGNFATTNGGAILNESDFLSIENSLLFGNMDSNDSQIYNNNDGILSISYTGLEGGTSAISGTGVVNAGSGNINLSSSDDVFVNPISATSAPTALGDYHLATFSPVINQADNATALSYSLTLDFEGDARILEGTVDMGADENARCNITFPYTANTADELRLAILCANLTAITDTILLGTDITLTEIDNETDGNNGLPSVTTPIVFGGAGNTLERSDSISETFRLFHVSTSGTLQLYNLTLSNGSAQDTGSSTLDDNGGAIFNWGVLEVNNSTAISNTASQFGGAIVNNGGAVTVTNSTLSDNSATSDGGAIYNTGSTATVTVTNSTLSGNSTSNDGGAIYNTDSTATVTNSILNGNSATSNGGAIYNVNGTATVTNSTLSGNSAIIAGAIVNFGNLGTATMTVTNSILSGNVATIAGAIVNDSGTLTMTNSILSGNSATSNGGAIVNNGGTVTVTNSTLSGNSATNQGGAIVNTNFGTATVTNSVVWGNDAPSDPQIDNDDTLNLNYSGVEDLGSVNVTSGANNINLSSSDDVFVDHISPLSAPTTLGDYHLSDTSVVINQGDNATALSYSLTLDFEGDDRILEGTVDMGADENDRCSIFPATVNTADELIFAINCANITAITDTITLGANITLTDVDHVAEGNNGTPTISTPIILDGAGFAIERSNAITETFRILRVNGVGNLELRNALIRNGSVQGAGVAGYGGGVFSRGTVTLINTIVSGNDAFGVGGGLYGINGAMSIQNSTIAGNYANFGGGVRNVGTATTIANSLIWGNGATAGSPQYANTGSTTMTYTGIEGGFAGTGNINLSSGDDVFVAPELASSAPTTAGDYHLTTTSVAISKGDSNFVSSLITTDIDGDNRILFVNVDMGADEVNFCSGFTFPYTATTADELIRAMACANSTVAEDTINLSGTISLTRVDNVASGNNGLPNIVRPLIIEGNGNVIERSSATSDDFRIFHVGKNQTFTLQNVTLRNGHATETNTNISTDDDGGAFLNRGTSTLINVLIHGNRALSVGGGFYNLQGTSTLDNVTIAGNYANFGGGMRIYTGTVTMENSLVAKNSATAGANQIGNSAVLNLQSTGVENLSLVSYTNNGGNFGISSAATVFIAAETASNAPTTAGDYHLRNLSPAVNKGNNNLIPAGVTTDFEGVSRILNTVVDVGADERAFALPPQNSNLVFNPGFDHASGDLAGWSLIGSIVADTSGGGVNLSFPATVDGWLRQIRGAYQLQIGLKMVSWVTVNNPSAVTRTFQFVMRDTVGGDNYLCTFSVAPSVTRTYYMQFLTQSDWEAIRMDVRPNFVGGGGLNFDDVELRYRPNATFATLKECISPSSDEAPVPPPDNELVMTNETVGTPNGVSENQSADVPLHVPTGCTALDWFNTANWKGYLPTSEVQFVFDPFPPTLTVGTRNGASVYDANGDGVADTLYDALSYNGHGHAVSLQNPPSVYGGNEGGSASATLMQEAVIAMLNDRYDSNHPESWWAVEIDTAEALSQGDNAMLALAQQYAISNATCG